VYAPKRSLPPELLNPEAHPSPYEDPKKKKCTVFFLKSDNIVTSKLGNPIGGQQALNTGSTGGLIGGATSSNTGIVSHLYESSGDEFSETEDVENPNYSAFWQGLHFDTNIRFAQPFFSEILVVNKLVDFRARVKFFRMIVNPLSVSQRSLKLALSSDGRPQQRRRHLMLAGISSNSTHYSRERRDQRSLDENIYFIFVYLNRTWQADVPSLWIYNSQIRL